MQQQPAVGEAPETPEREALGTEEPSAASEAAESAASSEAAADSAEQEPAREERPAEAAVVPVPGLHRQEQPKTSFWKRIRLSRRGGVSAATGDDVMIARLDAIEAGEQDLAERIRQLDERFTEVWEVEEQLSRLVELREMLEDIQERQGRIDGRTRTLQRRLSLTAGLAAAAALFAGAAAALALL